MWRETQNPLISSQILCPFAEQSSLHPRHICSKDKKSAGDKHTMPLKNQFWIIDQFRKTSFPFLGLVSFLPLNILMYGAHLQYDMICDTQKQLLLYKLAR
jgi:hypothetical protein